MWGNDPGVTPDMVMAGTHLQQTFLNPAAKPLMQHYGWADRLNGPVDNRLSSCLSCHSTAERPHGSILPPGGAGPTARLRWFRNIKAGDPFDDDGHHESLDYSLQLSDGIQRFDEAHGMLFAATINNKKMLFNANGLRVFPVTRDENDVENVEKSGLGKNAGPAAKSSAPQQAPRQQPPKGAGLPN